LSVKRVPCASCTASEEKFSLAMSLRFDRWSRSSSAMDRATSGIAVPTASSVAWKAATAGSSSSGGVLAM